MLEILPLDEEDAPSSFLPSRPHKCIMQLEFDLDLVRRCGIPYMIIKVVADDLHASSTHLETHEVIVVPPQPLGAPQVYFLENKGPTPYPSLLRVLHFIMAPMELIRPLRGSYDMHRLLFDLLRGLFFHL